MWHGTPLEAVSDNHSPDLMHVRQLDHLNFKDVGVTLHRQLTRAVSGFSWAWTTLVRSFGCTPLVSVLVRGGWG